MSATKRGVYHNLKESKYTVSNSEIVFFFSSEFYLKKFMDGHKKHRERLTDKIGKEGIDNHLNMETLADISYYLLVEKRGFFVTLRGLSITPQDLHDYALRKMKDKNTLEWKRINRPKKVIEKKKKTPTIIYDEMGL